MDKEQLLDPLTRINTLKMMTSADLRVSNQVRFALIDVRVDKKPRLHELFKRKSKRKLLQAPAEFFEVDHRARLIE
jgi:hypothetical protein